MFVQSLDTLQDYDLSQLDYSFDQPMEHSFEGIGDNSREEARVWRQTVIAHHQRTQAVLRLLTSDLQADMADRLAAEMQHIYTTIKSGIYPTCVFTVRWHLLNAISDIVLGCQEKQDENDDMVRAYVEAAKIELGFFEIELFRLGVD